MRVSIFVIVALLIAKVCDAGEVTREQQLIIACHRLDVEGVVEALRDGADVNGRFGDGDAKSLQDPWSLGRPFAAKGWTPLIAVANASDYPDPPRKVENTFADLDWARRQKANVPPEEVQKRKNSALSIVLVLLSHSADIDADDGRGATALYAAVYLKKLEVVKLLLRFNANVNTKTGIYIDGSGDITPLHRAYWSAEVTRLLLEKGADPSAKDTSDKTPLDWAGEFGGPDVRRLYESR